MHSIFNDIVELVRVKNDPVTEFNSYVKVLSEPLANLSGDTSEGYQVSGDDCWLSGVNGAVGAYSSSAGRRVLTARLRAALPRIGEE